MRGGPDDPRTRSHDPRVMESVPIDGRHTRLILRAGQWGSLSLNWKPQKTCLKCLKL